MKGIDSRKARGAEENVKRRRRRRRRTLVVICLLRFGLESKDVPLSKHWQTREMSGSRRHRQNKKRGDEQECQGEEQEKGKEIPVPLLVGEFARLIHCERHPLQLFFSTISSCTCTDNNIRQMRTDGDTDETTRHKHIYIRQQDTNTQRRYSNIRSAPVSHRSSPPEASTQVHSQRLVHLARIILQLQVKLCAPPCLNQPQLVRDIHLRPPLRELVEVDLALSQLVKLLETLLDVLIRELPREHVADQRGEGRQVQERPLALLPVQLGELLEDSSQLGVEESHAAMAREPLADLLLPAL
eukprot:768622-Hanusia_phi.AAC.7